MAWRQELVKQDNWDRSFSKNISLIYHLFITHLICMIPHFWFCRSSVSFLVDLILPLSSEREYHHKSILKALGQVGSIMKNLCLVYSHNYGHLHYWSHIFRHHLVKKLVLYELNYSLGSFTNNVGRLNQYEISKTYPIFCISALSLLVTFSLFLVGASTLI